MGLSGLALDPIQEFTIQNTKGNINHRLTIFVFYRRFGTMDIAFYRIRNTAYMRDKQIVSRTDLSHPIWIMNICSNRETRVIGVIVRSPVDAICFSHSSSLPSDDLLTLNLHKCPVHSSNIHYHRTHMDMAHR